MTQTPDTCAIGPMYLASKHKSAQVLKCEKAATFKYFLFVSRLDMITYNVKNNKTSLAARIKPVFNFHTL